MCGIFGAFSNKQGHLLSETTLREITRLSTRRGPDDEGFWTDGVHCSLGFRRLAILDLSQNGHQPMESEDGRYVLVFNGELYNFREIRRDLEFCGYSFRSTGDAEVVLYSLAQWGKSALQRFNGMYALGFYDRLKKKMFLARDHAGIKPLYWMRGPNGVVFASQYNQILSHPWANDLHIDPVAMRLYLNLGYIPAPYALHQGVAMLEPGGWVEIDAQGRCTSGLYFKFSRFQQPDLFGHEAVEAVDAAIAAAVKRQLVSDVAVGSFLSGGIDSPLVTAKMADAAPAPVRAFTIGTIGEELDESKAAARYAAELGLEHVVRNFSAEDCLALVDDVVCACSEPFADYSMFPTLLVSQLAREQVKVIVSGDGGDELFWGYSARFSASIRHAGLFRLPALVRRGLRRLNNRFRAEQWPWGVTMPDIGSWYRARHSGLFDDQIEAVFPGIVAWPQNFDLFDYRGFNQGETARWLRWNEYTGHLGMVLLKVDRASMHHSLEVRVPLLDREVVETAERIDWRTCLNLKTGEGKIPLRRSLKKHASFQTQEKKGFTIPLGAWLGGELRELFCDTLLGRDVLLGIPFESAAVENLYRRHRSGEQDYTTALWVLLSLALWEKRHLRPCKGTA